MITFWASFGENWATFYSTIWSHWLRRSSRNSQGDAKISECLCMIWLTKVYKVFEFSPI